MGFDGYKYDAFLVDKEGAFGGDGFLIDAFLIREAPQISLITPASGGVNKKITIDGSGFGSAISKSQVIFSKNTEEIIIPNDDIVSWADDEIQCYVPEQIDITGDWDISIRIVSNE